MLVLRYIQYRRSKVLPYEKVTLLFVKNTNRNAIAELVFIITTDGMENASHRYTSERVKAMIERQKEKCGWEFLFIGANIDAVETAAQYGINSDRTVNYNVDEKGTKILYATVSESICKMRTNAPLQADWSADINSDYEKRRKNVENAKFVFTIFTGKIY